jgi:signal transduction histidine kinase
VAGARTRHVAGASVGLTGLALVGVAVAHAVGRSLPPAGLALAGLGAAVGLALAVAGWLLARSGLDGRRALRVAGWNLLGVAVTGTTVGLVLAYQSSVGPAVARPVLSGAVIVGVSAVAHVLVGYNDVKRIRAGELAAERRKLAVTNRVVRHDLRTQAQLLYGCADRAAAATGDADLAARIRESGDDLADLRRTTTLIQDVVEGETPTGRVAVGPLLEAVVADRRERHPDATVASSAPDGLAVVAPEALREAVAELVDNAVEHAGPEPVVRVTARPLGDRVEITVADDGPGIPDDQWALVAGEREITQLSHGSGLGLWLVRWVVEAAAGEMERRPAGEGDDDHAVSIRLPRA